MKEILKKSTNFALGKGKMNIRRRTLRMALFGTVLTAFITVGLAFYAIFTTEEEMSVKSRTLWKEVGMYMDKSMKAQVEQRLDETTKLRAQLLDRTLRGMEANSKLLSDKLTHILEYRDQHVGFDLPYVNYENVPGKTPYVHLSPELIKNGISPALREEIRLVSSMSDEIERLEKRYNISICIISKKGYTIRADEALQGENTVFLTKEPYRNSYDPRKAIWFQKGMESQSTFFTDPYISPTRDTVRVSAVTPYYDNGEVAGIISFDCDPGYLYEQFAESTMEDSEFSFILGRKGEIIYSSVENGTFSQKMMDFDLRNAKDKILAETAQNMMAGKNGIAKVNADGKRYYLAYDPLPLTGWSLGTVMDEDLILTPARESAKFLNGRVMEHKEWLDAFFLKLSIVSIVLFLAIIAVIVKLSYKETENFIAPIDELTKGVQEIAGGNLEKKLSLKTGDELENLADNFNVMTEKLSAYMKNLAETVAVNERIETELSLASRIQAGMLPNKFPPFPNRNEFDIYAIMQPAKEVGGDFYDFYFLDENHLVITIADVSDKGAPAALFMVGAKTLLKENLLTAKKAEKLSDACFLSNNRLAENNKEDMFVTLFIGILNVKTGEFIYANAGHNLPILRHNDETAYLERAKSPIMGIMPNLEFPITTINLAKGDALFLYTDGVTEAMNEKKELYGEKRLAELLATAPMDAKQMLETALSSVKAHAGSALQSDDITMLGLVYKG